MGEKFDPTNLANEICSIIKNNRPEEAEHITLDIIIDVGRAHRAYYDIFFLNGRMKEVDFYSHYIGDESKNFFQQAPGELDNSQVTRLLNAISYRLSLTPTKATPRKQCVIAHWNIA